MHIKKADWHHSSILLGFELVDGNGCSQGSQALRLSGSQAPRLQRTVPKAVTHTQANFCVRFVASKYYH
jgi:hypothetical protein